MEHIMHIKWDTGHMEIDLDQFFPTPLARMRKLLKVIRLDWEHCDSLMEDLKVYFLDRIFLYHTEMERAKKEYPHLNQRVCDLKQLVKTRKKPVGVCLTKEEYCQAKKDLSEAKKQFKELVSGYKKNTANLEKFRRLLEEVTL